MSTPQSLPTLAVQFNIYKRLLRYLLPYWKYLILVLIGFIINALTEVSIAKLMQFIIDAINNQNQQHKNWFPVFIIGMFIIRGAGSFMGNYFTAFVSRNLIHSLRTEVFSHILRLPNRFFQQYSGGHLSAKIIFNIEQVTGAATDALRSLIRDGLVVIGLLGWLIFVNWRLTLCLLIVVPAIALVVRKASHRMQRLSTDIQSSMGDISHITNESINGYMVVKSFGGEAYETKRFSDASLNNLRKGLKMVVTASLNTPLVQLFMAIGMSAIVWIALRPEIFSGTSTGEFISYLTAAGLLSKPVKSLTEINEKLQRGIAAADSVFAILDTPIETDTGTLTPTIDGNIQLQQVNLYYPDGVQALRDINLTIPAGKTVALVGRSGAGKTSLVNLLIRLENPTNGNISIDNTSIYDITLAHLRKNISFVGQHVSLFDATVTHNIAYGELAQYDFRLVQQAAKDAYADDFINLLPDGYHTTIGTSGLSLSGGQRQRLAIARALLKDAPILILDEATSALDNESEFFIQKALSNIMQNRTTIVIAHRLSTIENADLIVVMDKGQIVEQGTHAQLLANNQLYTQLHQRQFAEQ